ncbi:MAG TPA: glutathione S-transferase [Rhabdaerophilum sp.]|nr:glutathione S-transferase [Rhabdaerophilum sp.]
MKLYDGGRVPNARRVRIFLAEKGISVPMVPVDLGKKEHRSEEFTARNPLQRVPVLELDDGTVLTESVAICRYFEALHPEPALFGTGALGKALVEMWNRRAEFELYLAVQAAFRHLHPGMAGYEVPQVAEWGEVNKGRAIEAMRLFDRQLAANRFVAGADFSIADITAFVSVEFLKAARLSVPDDMKHLARWRDEVAARPGAAA